MCILIYQTETNICSKNQESNISKMNIQDRDRETTLIEIVKPYFFSKMRKKYEYKTNNQSVGWLTKAHY